MLLRTTSTVCVCVLCTSLCSRICRSLDALKFLIFFFTTNFVEPLELIFRIQNMRACSEISRGELAVAAAAHNTLFGIQSLVLITLMLCMVCNFVKLVTITTTSYSRTTYFLYLFA